MLLQGFSSRKAERWKAFRLVAGDHHGPLHMLAKAELEKGGAPHDVVEDRLPGVGLHHRDMLVGRRVKDHLWLEKEISREGAKTPSRIRGREPSDCWNDYWTRIARICL